MSSELQLKMQVLETFQALLATLQDLEINLKTDQSLPAWFQAPPNLMINPEDPLRRQAFALIGQLEYLKEQKPREILVGAGLIAASNATLSVIQDLNSCKSDFKNAILALKNSNISLHDDFLNHHFENLLNEQFEKPSSNAKKLGLQRLHLKQCYRKIPILVDRPEKVSWTWANTRAITRISIPEAEQLLLKQRNNPNAQVQLNRLQALKPEESLAIVQELAPHLRANIILNQGGEIKRMMVKGPVPLFYLAKDDLTLPHIKPPKEKQGKDVTRKLRSDIKIDPEPFLPAIRAHRYLDKN